MTKEQNTSSPSPDLIRIANILRGVSLHLKATERKKRIVLAGPVEAIDDIVDEIDTWEAENADG